MLKVFPVRLFILIFRTAHVSHLDYPQMSGNTKWSCESCIQGRGDRTWWYRGLKADNGTWRVKLDGRWEGRADERKNAGRDDAREGECFEKVVWNLLQQRSPHGDRPVMEVEHPNSMPHASKQTNIPKQTQTNKTQH